MMLPDCKRLKDDSEDRMKELLHAFAMFRSQDLLTLELEPLAFF
jgi:hypothetical protein